MPPRTHPLERSPRVDRLNDWLTTAWDKGLSSYPSLDPQELLAKGACDYKPNDLASGRSAEDAADFVLRLERLCEALVTEADLNPLGRTIAHGQLVRVIRQRHGLGALWARRPELLETELAPPIIVVGQMRAGTTRIHRLLAADPRHAATRFCDSWHPVPEKLDMRPIWSGIALAMGRTINPWLDAIHPFSAAHPDEELGWLAAALNHAAYEAQWRIPGYSEWSEARDPAPVYHEYARILRTDAAHAGNADRVRVMKVPQFSEDLPALLAQFPDARLVVARRCNEEVWRSAVSLVANQMAIQSDTADLEWIEREWRRKLALRQARLEQALAGFAGPVAELDFDALNADWESAVERAYAALGIELTSAARVAMKAQMRGSAEGAHVAHSAQLKAFRAAATG